MTGSQQKILFTFSTSWQLFTGVLFLSVNSPHLLELSTKMTCKYHCNVNVQHCPGCLLWWSLGWNPGSYGDRVLGLLKWGACKTAWTWNTKCFNKLVTLHQALVLMLLSYDLHLPIWFANISYTCVNFALDYFSRQANINRGLCSTSVNFASQLTKGKQSKPSNNAHLCHLTQHLSFTMDVQWMRCARHVKYMQKLQLNLLGNQVSNTQSALFMLFKSS